jgi:hypothetical protein
MGLSLAQTYDREVSMRSPADASSDQVTGAPFVRLLEAFGRIQHQRQRRAQLVADIGESLDLDFIKLANTPLARAPRHTQRSVLNERIE